MHRDVQTSLMTEGHVLQHQNKLFITLFYIKAVELMCYLRKCSELSNPRGTAWFNFFAVPVFKGCKCKIICFKWRQQPRHLKQNWAPSFILQFSPCLFKHIRHTLKGKRSTIWNWELTFFFVDLLSLKTDLCLCLSLAVCSAAVFFRIVEIRAIAKQVPCALKVKTWYLKSDKPQLPCIFSGILYTYL